MVGSGVRQRHPIKKGTAVKKNYQTTTSRGMQWGRTTPKKVRSDAARTAHEAAVALPTVTVAIVELAGELKC